MCSNVTPLNMFLTLAPQNAFLLHILSSCLNPKEFSAFFLKPVVYSIKLIGILNILFPSTKASEGSHLHPLGGIFLQLGMTARYR